MKAIKWILLAGMILGMNNVALADRDDDDDDAACTSTTINRVATDFGPEVVQDTTCLSKRKKVKIVIQINKSCRDSYVHDGQVKNSAAAWDNPVAPVKCKASRAYALGNMAKMIRDYEEHGMDEDDYEMVAVVHSGGGFQLLAHPGRNQFQQDVMDLMEKGVKFYFCQNTVRGFMHPSRGYLLPVDNAAGITLAEQLVPGTQFVTAGITAIVDFQKQGYTYVQP